MMIIDLRSELENEHLRQASPVQKSSSTLLNRQSIQISVPRRFCDKNLGICREIRGSFSLSAQNPVLHFLGSFSHSTHGS
jgi:hypothetical protein